MLEAYLNVQLNQDVTKCFCEDKQSYKRNFSNLEKGGVFYFLKNYSENKILLKLPLLLKLERKIS